MRARTDKEQRALEDAAMGDFQREKAEFSKAEAEKSETYQQIVKEI